MDELNFGTLPKDRGILHARRIVRRPKRDGLVNQHDGNQMLKADVRDLSIVDNRCLGGRDADDDLLHLFRAELMTLEQGVQGVEGRLNRRADRPFLDVGPRDFVPLA